MTTHIHPSAIVHPGAELGDDVRIGPYCVVDGRVRIGRATVLEPFVHIADYTELGEECHIFNHAVLGQIPQDHLFAGEESWARIGNRVTCRENVTINRGSGEGGETTVGDDCLIMEGVHLGHNSRVGKNVSITNMVGLSGYVEIGDHAVIGGMSGFHQFVKVGCYAMVGGFSRISKDVPPYCLVAGYNPRVFGLNNVGLKRNGFTQEQRNRIKGFYEQIYRSNLPIREALEHLKSQHGDDEFARVILEFSASLRRGLTPWVDRDQKNSRGADDLE